VTSEASEPFGRREYEPASELVTNNVCTDEKTATTNSFAPSSLGAEQMAIGTFAMLAMLTPIHFVLAFFDETNKRKLEKLKRAKLQKFGLKVSSAFSKFGSTFLGTKSKTGRTSKSRNTSKVSASGNTTNNSSGAMSSTGKSSGTSSVSDVSGMSSANSSAHSGMSSASSGMSSASSGMSSASSGMSSASSGMSSASSNASFVSGASENDENESDWDQSEMEFDSLASGVELSVVDQDDEEAEVGGERR